MVPSRLSASPLRLAVVVAWLSPAVAGGQGPIDLAHGGRGAAAVAHVSVGSPPAGGFAEATSPSPSATPAGGDPGSRTMPLELGETTRLRCPAGNLRITRLESGRVDIVCDLAVAPTLTPTLGPPTAVASQTPAPTHTALPTLAAAPTPTLAPTSAAAPPTGPSAGLWISSDEVRRLPMSGPAWSALRAAADGGTGTPTLCDQNSNSNVLVLAKALVFARTGEETYRTDVRRAVLSAMGTESGGSCRSLALGRELAAYVIAADLVGLTAAEDAAFRGWLAGVRTKKLGDSRSLVSCHEDRPNNWGTMCGASRAAASAYLGDRADLDRTARVFKGYVGDRASYAGFAYGDTSWQGDPSQPRGINAAGATKQGVDIDGAIPDDMRRGAGFTTGCPSHTGYPWEALQGVVVQAEILHRQGYDAWGWEQQAVRRALAYLYGLDARCGGWASEATSGDDKFVPWIVNHVYGTRFTATTPAQSGKIMGWTDWTHDRATRTRP